LAFGCVVCEEEEGESLPGAEDGALEELAHDVSCEA
jgi:hypothetical protein